MVLSRGGALAREEEFAMGIQQGPWPGCSPGASTQAAHELLRASERLPSAQRCPKHKTEQLEDPPQHGKTAVVSAHIPCLKISNLEPRRALDQILHSQLPSPATFHPGQRQKDLYSIIHIYFTMK